MRACRGCRRTSSSACRGSRRKKPATRPWPFWTWVSSISRLPTSGSTIEPGTRFGELAKRGRLPLPVAGVVAEGVRGARRGDDEEGLRPLRDLELRPPGPGVAAQPRLLEGPGVPSGSTIARRSGSRERVGERKQTLREGSAGETTSCPSDTRTGTRARPWSRSKQRRSCESGSCWVSGSRRASISRRRSETSARAAGRRSARRRWRGSSRGEGSCERERGYASRVSSGCGRTIRRRGFSRLAPRFH